MYPQAINAATKGFIDQPPRAGGFAAAVPKALADSDDLASVVDQ
jgi:hypothetical protein